jgi:hypothetical protein
VNVEFLHHLQFTSTELPKMYKKRLGFGKTPQQLFYLSERRNSSSSLQMRKIQCSEKSKLDE